MSHVQQPETRITSDGWSSFADRYEKSIGITTRHVAKRLLLESPPFSKNSVVLDDACGTGIITEEVQETLRSQPDVTVKVYAADSAPQMVQVFDSKVNKAKESDNWPNIAEVYTNVARAEDLDESIVPSDLITHAYMNFGIFFCSDPLKAASHIYRSLAPGGTAFFTTWADLGYENTMRNTEKTCNPDGQAFALPWAQEWEQPEYLASILREAGFNNDKIRHFQQSSFFRAKTVVDMAGMHQQMFESFTRIPNRFKDEAERSEWKKVLIENTVNDDHFYEEADCVKMRMLANVVVCTK